MAIRASWRNSAECCVSAKNRLESHRIAQDRTGSHRIAQDRTGLAIDALLLGVLLAKWSCRIAPGTLVAGCFFDHRVLERRAEFNLEIESVRSCRHHQMKSVASHLALHLYFLH